MSEFVNKKKPLSGSSDDFAIIVYSWDLRAATEQNRHFIVTILFHFPRNKKIFISYIESDFVCEIERFKLVFRCEENK